MRSAVLSIAVLLMLGITLSRADDFNDDGYSTGAVVGGYPSATYSTAGSYAAGYGGIGSGYATGNVVGYSTGIGSYGSGYGAGNVIGYSTGIGSYGSGYGSGNIIGYTTGMGSYGSGYGHKRSSTVYVPYAVPVAQPVATPSIGGLGGIGAGAALGLGLDDLDSTQNTGIFGRNGAGLITLLFLLPFLFNNNTTG